MIDICAIRRKAVRWDYKFNFFNDKEDEPIRIQSCLNSMVFCSCCKEAWRGVDTNRIVYYSEYWKIDAINGKKANWFLCGNCLGLKSNKE